MINTKKKFFFLKIFIFFSILFSILFSHKILSQNDKIISKDNKIYHKMIKADPYRYLSHGAEIKDEVEKGKNFFLAGRDHYTKFLPPRLAAFYYLITDRNLFNNLDDREINLGVHFEYLIFQCLIYFFSIYLLFNSIKNRFDNKVVIILIVALCIEPTITQYNFSFWSESIFFSFQILILAFLLKKNQSEKNLIFLGILLGFLSLQRQIGFFYIIPILIFYLIFYKNYLKLSYVIISFLLIQLSIGYINKLKLDNFHFMTADSKIEIHRSYVGPVMSKKKSITLKEFNFEEGIVVKKWLEVNKIDYKNEGKFIVKEKNFVDWMDYRREIISENDRVKFDDYIKSRSLNFIKLYPTDFIKHYFQKSIHMIVLNPFHIYSDLNFSSGEIYYETNSHKKFIPIRIAYTSFLYFIALVGLIILIKKKEYKITLLLVLSLLYFFSLVGWSGNTRYFVPNLIYILVFFSFGLNFILKKYIRNY